MQHKKLGIIHNCDKYLEYCTRWDQVRGSIRPKLKRNSCIPTPLSGILLLSITWLISCFYAVMCPTGQKSRTCEVFLQNFTCKYYPFTPLILAYDIFVHICHVDIGTTRMTLHDWYPLVWYSVRLYPPKYHSVIDITGLLICFCGFIHCVTFRDHH